MPTTGFETETPAERDKTIKQTTGVCDGCGPIVEQGDKTCCCSTCAGEAGRMLPKRVRRAPMAAALLGAGVVIARRLAG